MRALPDDFRVIAIDMRVADPDLQWTNLTKRDASPSKASWLAWLKTAPKLAPEVKVKCIKPRDDGDAVTDPAERLRHLEALRAAVKMPSIAESEASRRARSSITPRTATPEQIAEVLRALRGHEADPQKVFEAYRAQKRDGSGEARRDIRQRRAELQHLALDMRGHCELADKIAHGRAALRGDANRAPTIPTLGDVYGVKSSMNGAKKP